VGIEDGYKVAKEQHNPHHSKTEGCGTLKFCSCRESTCGVRSKGRPPVLLHP
jgi:hypothetical protein